MGRPEIVLGLLLLAVILSGCSNEATSTATEPLVLKGSTCSGPWADHCEIDQGQIRISDIESDAEHETGIRIESPSLPVVLENIRLDRVSVGVRISDLCGTCQISVVDAHIGYGSIGLHVDTGPGSPALSLSNVTLLSQPSPARTYGIHYTGPGGGLDMSDVTIEGQETQPGYAILHEGLGDASLTNVTMMHIQRGIVGKWPSLVIVNGLIECGTDAIWTSSDEFSATNLTVRNCLRGAPPCSPQCRYPAIQIADTVEQLLAGDRAKSFHLKDSSIINNSNQAIYVRPVVSANLEGVNVVGNGAGINLFDANSTVMTRSNISHNADFGVTLGARQRLDISDTWFYQNGPGPYQYGGLAIASPAPTLIRGETEVPELVIRNSAFEGNTPWGIYAGSAPVDARFNWWGHIGGPTPHQGKALGPSGQLLGDYVTEMVISKPQLTAPPVSG